MYITSIQINTNHLFISQLHQLARHLFINIQMATNRSNISVNRTLLILLGILLACVLMLNAQPIRTADLLSDPTKKSTPAIDVPTPKTFIDKMGSNGLKDFIKKVSSLN